MRPRTSASVSPASVTAGHNTVPDRLSPPWTPSAALDDRYGPPGPTSPAQTFQAGLPADYTFQPTDFGVHSFHRDAEDRRQPLGDGNRDRIRPGNRQHLHHGESGTHGSIRRPRSGWQGGGPCHLTSTVTAEDAFGNFTPRLRTVPPRWTSSDASADLPGSVDVTKWRRHFHGSAEHTGTQQRRHPQPDDHRDAGAPSPARRLSPSTLNGLCSAHSSRAPPAPRGMTAADFNGRRHSRPGHDRRTGRHRQCAPGQGRRARIRTPLPMPPASAPVNVATGGLQTAMAFLTWWVVKLL